MANGRELLMANRAALMAGGDLSAKSYLQDGLIMMFDAIESAGYGSHSSTTAWTDLASNTTVNPSGTVTMSSDSVDWSGVYGCYTVPKTTDYDQALADLAFTFSWRCRVDSIVSAVSGNFAPLGSFGTSLRSISGNNSITYVQLTGEQSNFFPPIQPGYGETHTFDMAVSGSTVSIYYDGALHISKTFPYSTNRERMYIGALWGYSNVKWNGSIHNVRFYNKTLSASEVAANYAVDVARYAGS